MQPACALAAGCGSNNKYAVPQTSNESCLVGNCGRPFMHAGAPYTVTAGWRAPQGLSRHYALLQHDFACCRVGQQQAPACGST